MLLFKPIFMVLFWEISLNSFPFFSVLVLLQAPVILYPGFGKSNSSGLTASCFSHLRDTHILPVPHQSSKQRRVTSLSCCNIRDFSEFKVFATYAPPPFPVNSHTPHSLCTQARPKNCRSLNIPSIFMISRIFQIIVEAKNNTENLLCATPGIQINTFPAFGE